MPASESQTFDWTWRKSRLNIAIIRLDIHAAPYQLNSSPNRLWFVSNIELNMLKILALLMVYGYQFVSELV